MIVVVNSTANRSSGSLSILNQFVNHLTILRGEDKYLIFTAPTYKCPDIANVLFISINTQHWIKRIKWDLYGLKKWLKQHNIIPDILVSLQNTGVNYDAPQIIYYHQPIPLVNYKWNLLKKEERLFYLYKKIYPLFVKRSLTNNTHIVVQIQSIKNAFVSKFKVKESSVSVIRPDINIMNYEEVPYIEFDNEINFLYPSTPYEYKNHIEIVNAINALNFKNPNLVKKIKVHFTFNANENQKLLKQITHFGLIQNFIFEGQLPFEKLLSYYKSCSALLFPSYIETFGLPIIEAAGAGLPIIISDVPYSRDVIGNYEGAKFVPLHNTSEWCNAIESLCVKPTKRYAPYVQSKKSSWYHFFHLIQFITKNTKIIIY